MRSRDKYLYLSRHHIFYFRVIVSLTGSDLNSKHEYRRSLRTRDPKVARYIGRVMRFCFEDFCVPGEVSAMEWEQIKQILDKKLMQLIAEEKDKIREKGPYTIQEERGWENLNIPLLKNMVTDLSNNRLIRQAGQDVPVPQSVDEMVSEFFDEHNLTSPESDELYLQACEATLHMMIRFTQEQILMNREARSFRSEQGLPSPSRQDSCSHYHTKKNDI